MLRSPPLTDPDVRISRIRFLTWKICSSGGILMNDFDRRRVWVEHGPEACPGQVALTAAPAEPILPYPLELIAIPPKGQALPVRP